MNKSLSYVSSWIRTPKYFDGVMPKQLLDALLNNNILTKQWLFDLIGWPFDDEWTAW